jgi:hypothetical protein
LPLQVSRMPGYFGLLPSPLSGEVPPLAAFVLDTVV